MNPSQIKSSWKSLFQDDIQRRGVPPQPDPPNPPQERNPRPTNHTAFPPPLALPTLQQYTMKASAFEWHAEREQQLFALHRQHGNKWTAIAEHLGIDDNAVKNKFYSTLRRGLRRLNRYITEVKRKLTPTHLAANKYIKDELLVKVNAVADRTSEEKYNEKYEVKQPAIAVSKEIQSALIELAGVDTSYQHDKGQLIFEQQLLNRIHQFNRNCKRRKGKRKLKNQDHNKESQSDRNEMRDEQLDEASLEKPPPINNNLQNLNPSLQTSTTPKQSRLDYKKQEIVEGEKSFRNQEVQFSDQQLQEEKNEIEQKNQTSQIHPLQDDASERRGTDHTMGQLKEESHNFDFNFSIEDSHDYRGSLLKQFKSLNPTPAFTSRFSFPDHLKSLHLSVSSFNSTLFQHSEKEKGNSFLDTIPSMKYKGNCSLFDSEQLQKQIQAMNNLERAQSASNGKPENVGFNQERASLIFEMLQREKQKQEDKQ